MKCEYCGGSGKIDINEPGAYGYMTCDKCDGYGAMCDICGRPMLLGECEWCALARAEGESFVKTHGLPWGRHEQIDHIDFSAFRDVPECRDSARISRKSP